jgi:hypothetical protein
MENGPQILETPIWLLGARIAQAVLALIIMAMAGVLMHGAYLDVHGLCVATVSRNRDEAVYQHPETNANDVFFRACSPGLSSLTTF